MNFIIKFRLEQTSAAKYQTSAYKWGRQWGFSIIRNIQYSCVQYKKQDRGPRTEPCGSTARRG